MEVIPLPFEFFPTVPKTEALQIEGPLAQLSVSIQTNGISLHPDFKDSLPLRITKNELTARPSRVFVCLSGEAMYGIFLNYPTWGDIRQAIYAITQNLAQNQRALPEKKYQLTSYVRDIYGQLISLEFA